MHLYQILYLMMLQASSKALLQRRSQRRCFLVDFVEFLRTPFLKISSGRLHLTLQVYKNVSRDRSKDIKVIPIEAISMTYNMVRKL